MLTGFDAPVLYAMYLDKPMRDQTLLQAIARANRPYENEAQEMVKPHGFVLDFVGIFDGGDYVVIDGSTIETIQRRGEGSATKVINLVKAIQKEADDRSEDPLLVAMAERSRAVQETFEDRQESTGEAIESLLAEIDRNERRKAEQAATGLDGLTYFILCRLTEDGISNADKVSRKIQSAGRFATPWPPTSTGGPARPICAKGASR